MNDKEKDNIAGGIWNILGMILVSGALGYHFGAWIGFLMAGIIIFVISLLHD